jgi:hypothetical protein
VRPCVIARINSRVLSHFWANLTAITGQLPCGEASFQSLSRQSNETGSHCPETKPCGDARLTIHHLMELPMGPRANWKGFCARRR